MPGALPTEQDVIQVPLPGTQCPSLSGCSVSVWLIFTILCTGHREWFLYLTIFFVLPCPCDFGACHSSHLGAHFLSIFVSLNPKPIHWVPFPPLKYDPHDSLSSGFPTPLSTHRADNHMSRHGDDSPGFRCTLSCFWFEKYILTVLRASHLFHTGHYSWDCMF